MTKTVRMRLTTMIARRTAQIMIIIIAVLRTAPWQSTIIRRAIIRTNTKLTHPELLQPLLSAAWDAVIKTAQMLPIITIVRRTAQITIIIIAAIWIALKQITTIAAKQAEAIMENTMMTAIIIKVDNRMQNRKIWLKWRKGAGELPLYAIFTTSVI
ncbi:MAG: hypothetical protein K2I22_15410 [Lachnospiraceae bacterium]|nr:hypothetical protein [Lachnospiraceae bacterium]